MKRLLFPSIALVLLGCSNPQIREPKIELLESPTNSLLQAISIVDENAVWLSGHNASFIRSTDGGENWELFEHPTIDSLQFRDIHGFDSDHAVLMSAGPGSLSRIFTFDAPNQWQENFVMQDSLGFLDCIDFWDDQNGIAYGDAIDNYPYILLTTNGGKSWNRADTTNMPQAGKGEGGFAASGTCVTTGANGKAWIATGAGGNCRFIVTNDYGKSWTANNSPLITGDAAGNTSVSFVGTTGVVTGGDLMKPEEYTDNCAFSTDGGNSWILSSQPQTKGAFYGSSITKVDETYFAFVCGPNGIDYSSNLGQTWVTLDSMNYWAINIQNEIGYASGTDGKILRISLQP
ncbi:hypothetical protein [Ekhidna sp.]